MSCVHVHKLNPVRSDRLNFLLHSRCATRWTNLPKPLVYFSTRVFQWKISLDKCLKLAKLAKRVTLGLQLQSRHAYLANLLFSISLTMSVPYGGRHFFTAVCAMPFINTGVIYIVIRASWWHQQIAQRTILWTHTMMSHIGQITVVRRPAAWLLSAVHIRCHALPLK